MIFWFCWHDVKMKLDSYELIVVIVFVMIVLSELLLTSVRDSQHIIAAQVPGTDAHQILSDNNFVIAGCALILQLQTWIYEIQNKNLMDAYIYWYRWLYSQFAISANYNLQ